VATTRELAARVKMLEEVTEVVLDALEELTLQCQYLLRSLKQTSKSPLVGSTPIAITFKELYLRDRAALIRELEHERQSLAETHSRGGEDPSQTATDSLDKQDASPTEQKPNPVNPDGEVCH
jgi:hypothetical protein